VKHIQPYDHFITEKRRNPELNVKRSITEEINNFIETYKDEPQHLFLHFSNMIRPMMINPRYKFSRTPIALYMYPMYNPENEKLDFIDSKSTINSQKLVNTADNMSKVYDAMEKVNFFHIDYHKQYDPAVVNFVSIAWNVYTKNKSIKHSEILNKMCLLFSTRIPNRHQMRPILVVDETDTVCIFDVSEQEIVEKTDISKDMLKSIYTSFFYQVAINGNKFHAESNARIIETLVCHLYKVDRSFADVPEITALYDQLGIKYHLKSSYLYTDHFEYFTHFEYVYCFKLKSLDGVLIDRKTTYAEMGEVVERMKTYIRQRWSDQAEDLISTYFKPSHRRTVESTHEHLKDLCSALDRTDSKNKLMYSIYKNAGVKGILTYDNNFIDDMIPNQLAIFDPSIIEEYAYFNNY
jgi:hypothetical protein